SSALDDTANSDDAPLDMRIGNNAPVGDDRLPQRRAIDFASRQKSRMRINRRLGIKEAVLRDEIGQVEVRFVKRAHRSDVFPVTLENERIHLSIFDSMRNDLFAEIE